MYMTNLSKICFKCQCLWTTCLAPDLFPHDGSFVFSGLVLFLQAFCFLFPGMRTEFMAFSKLPIFLQFKLKSRLQPSVSTCTEPPNIVEQMCVADQQYYCWPETSPIHAASMLTAASSSLHSTSNEWLRKMVHSHQVSPARAASTRICGKPVGLSRVWSHRASVLWRRSVHRL